MDECWILMDTFLHIIWYQYKSFVYFATSSACVLVCRGFQFKHTHLTASCICYGPWTYNPGKQLV